MTANEVRQEAVRAWLESGQAFQGQEPEVVVTHGNLIFLTDARAYKMKRPVDFGWMDFSTLEKRELACRNELVLNQRTAATLYLNVFPVTEAPDGFHLSAPGRPVEWLVEMQRFEEEARLDHLSDNNELTELMMRDLADAIAAFHRSAERAPPRDFAATLESIAEENERDMATAAGLFPPDKQALLKSLSKQEIQCHRALIAERVEAGWLRRCHGDLHLGNIVLWEGRPTPFDCIEFNEDFIAIDLLYDLAFLLMDLEQRGRRDLANLVLNRWLAMAPEPTQQLRGLALLPLLLSIRAGVRAKICGLQWLEAEGALKQQRGEEARRYLDYAVAVLTSAPASLLAVGGLSGSGKSTLAKALAEELGGPPGAVLLRSDVLRKRLYQVAPEQPLEASAYSEEANQRVIATLLQQTEAALRAGRSVVLDAVSADPQLRHPLGAIAEALECRFTGLWLDAPLETLKARVAARHGDASDASPKVVERQAETIQPPSDWQHIDASGPTEVTLAAARLALGR